MVAMCKPVLPLIQDEVAHLFWKAQHLATIHHHHGHYHAEEAIAIATQEEESNKVPATSKTSEPVSLHIIIPGFYSIPQLLVDKQKFCTRICSASSLTLDKYYPPPKTS
jgi:hypothetical protein